VQIATNDVFRTIALRTVLMASLVTITCIAIAFPIAFYMARIASARMRGILVVSILLPLWSGYLVKVYAWRLILAQNGVLNSILGPFGLHGPGYSDAAVWLVETYLWLPYMIIPVFAAFDRVPDSLIDASSDLGASDFSTARMIMAPLVFPGIAAGSIFTFSLSLGDYIAVTIVGGKTQLLGNVIYGQLVTANNQPLAAALSIIPLAAIIAYLLAIRRTGALENV
jgi:putative spermidine/putrescine transport system permease protein